MSNLRSIKPQIPSLRNVGFAVDYYHAYRAPSPQLHGTDVVLLSFIARGQGKHLLQDCAFREQAGNLSITHYGQQHALQTDDMDVFNIFVDPQHHPLPQLPDPLQTTLAQIIPLHPNFYHQPSSIMRLTIGNIDDMIALLHQIQQECSSPGEGHDEMMRLYMKLFLMRLCREAAPQLHAQARRLPSHPMEQLRLHLDATFSQPNRLPELAARVGIHPSSLCRAFKTHTGMTLMSYITERRLQATMLALRNTDHTIARLALDAGFPDISRYNRRFKARLGVTPSAYRKRFTHRSDGAG